MHTHVLQLGIVKLAKWATTHAHRSHGYLFLPYWSQAQATPSAQLPRQLLPGNWGIIQVYTHKTILGRIVFYRKQ